MYLISEVAKSVGLSRTAILYYEKLRLIKSKRDSNDYRLYSDVDIQRIKLLQLLLAGGLTLDECKCFLDTKLDHTILTKRLYELEKDIERKLESKKLLQSMLGLKGSKNWHTTASTLAPDAHLDWLLTQGFTLKEALRLKWLSKDMDKHDHYMNDFMKIFEGVERWGPSSDEDSLKALSMVPSQPLNILHIGCGKGLATILLANNTSATITAIDNEQSALDVLEVKLRQANLNQRVKTVCESMTELNFDDSSFDLIWSENSAYVMGVENAIKSWNRFLKRDGVLMVSDLVWLIEEPSETAIEFWKEEYPDMQTVQNRLDMFANNSFEVVQSFPINQQSWNNYYVPLKKRVETMQSEMSDSQALMDISYEIEIYEQFLGEFGYQMFILKN